LAQAETQPAFQPPAEPHVVSGDSSAQDRNGAAPSRAVPRWLARAAEDLAGVTTLVDGLAALSARLGPVVPHSALALLQLNEATATLEWLGVFDAEGGTPSLRAGRQMSVGASGTWLARALTTARPVWYADLAAAADSGAGCITTLAHEGVHSMVAAPVRSRRSVLALAALSLSPTTCSYQHQHAATLVQLADHVAGYLTLLHLLDQRQLEAKEEERDRVVQEMNGALARWLVETVVHINDAELHRRDERRLVERLVRARDAARAALMTSRALPGLVDQGRPLAQSLRELLASWQTGGTRARLFCRGEGRPVAPVIAAVVAVVQEALANARHHAQASEVRVEVEYSHDTVQVSIGDDGVGFEVDVDPGQAGGGLGLGIMREYAAGVGGRLTVSSWPGNGTRVSAVFPIDGAAPFTAATAEPTKDPAQQVRVLLVDDHPLFRKILVDQMAMTSDLSAVAEAGDADSALDAVGRLTPDVVLMDIALPRVDGITLTQQIIERYPRTRVVMFTCSDAEDDLRRAMQSGAAGYLLKESMFDTVADAVRAAHRGETPIEPRLTGGLVSWLKRSPEEEPLPEMLSERELDVLRLMVQGKRNRDIAEELVISEYTVKTHVGNIFAKLGVADRAAAVSLALRRNIGGVGVPGQVSIKARDNQRFVL
jgi:DNA-binding NarL/FixJ family response regulator/signal transduction histidine kinase